MSCLTALMWILVSHEILLCDMVLESTESDISALRVNISWLYILIYKTVTKISIYISHKSLNDIQCGKKKRLLFSLLKKKGRLG